MYPQSFFDTYWRGDIRSEVFVAMSFATEFTPVWKEAIQPAIEEDCKVIANRVDATVLSGDVVTKILDGIAHAELLFFDISKMTSGAWKGQRNGNVMYELGIAHTVRPDTDIVVVRSDKSSMPFDLAGIQVHSYQWSNLAEARLKFVNLLSSARKVRNQIMTLRIERARQRLDRACLNLMLHQGDVKNFTPFRSQDIADPEERSAVTRLLDLEIVRCETLHGINYQYAWTDFGIAVYKQPNFPK